MTKRKSGFQFGNIMYSYVNCMCCIISYIRNYITQIQKYAMTLIDAMEDDIMPNNYCRNIRLFKNF